MTELSEDIAYQDPIPKPTLSNEHRAKLDSIVQQMVGNKESEENIQAVVNDFKSKYIPSLGKRIQQSQSDKQTKEEAPAFQPMTNWLDIQQGYKPMVAENAVPIEKDFTQKAYESQGKVQEHLADIKPSIHNLIYNYKKDMLGRAMSEKLGTTKGFEAAPINQQAQALEAKTREDVAVHPDEVEEFHSEMQSNPGMARMALQQKIQDLNKSNPADSKKLQIDIYRADAANRKEKENKIEKNIKAIENGDINYNAIKGALIKKVGFWSGITEGYKQKVTAFDDYSVYKKGDEKEMLALINKRLQHDPDNPIVVGDEGYANILPGGSEGMMIGGQPLKPLIGGTAAGIIAGPEAGAAAGAAISAPEMYKLTFGSALPANYAAIKNKNPELSDSEVLQQAVDLTNRQSNADAATAAAMGAFGAKAAFKPTGITLNVLKKGVISALPQIGEAGAKKALEGLGVGMIGGGGQVIKNLMAQKAGIDTKWDEGVGEQIKGGIFFTMGLSLLAKSMGALKPKTKTEILSAVSKLPDDVINQEFNHMEDVGAITTEELQNAQKAIRQQRELEATVPRDMPESDRLKVQSKIQQRAELEQQLESVDKAYHPEIKEKIKGINEEIVSLSKGEHHEELQKLVNGEINKGNVEGDAIDVLRNSTEKELNSHLKEIADLANDPNTSEQTIATFGEKIVSKAKELYPVEEKPQSSISVIQPGEIKQPETITISPREQPKSIESNDIVSVIMPKERGNESITIKPQDNASTIEKPNEVDVRESSGNGEEMGSRNEQPEIPARTQEGGQAAPEGNATSEKGQEVANPETVGITHRQMDNIARELGLDTYEKDPESFALWDKQARERFAKDPQAADKLIQKLRNGDGVDKIETRMMIMHFADLITRYDKNPTPELLNEIKRTKDLYNISGREKGKELAARKATVPREETLADYHLTDIDFNKGAQLTEQQRAQSTKEYHEIKAAKDALEERVAKSEADKISAKADKKISEIAKTVSKTTKEKYAEGKDKTIESIKNKLGDKKLDKLSSEINNRVADNDVHEYLRKAKHVLNELFPDIEIKAYEKSKEYEITEQRPSGSVGVFDPVNKKIAFNLEGIKKYNANNTIFHEIIHPIVNEVIGKNEKALDNLYSKLSDLKNEPGMAAVWEHEGYYQGRGLKIQKVEAVTEFLSLVADGKIDTRSISERAITKVIDLVNKIFEAFGIDKKFSTGADLKRLADSIKLALTEGDTGSLKGLLEDGKSGVASTEAVDTIRGKSFEQIMKDIAPDLMTLVRNEISQGNSNLKGIVKQVHEQVKDIVPGITEKDIHNVIAGEYAEKKAPRSKVSEQLHDARTEASLINKLEQLLKGEEPKSEKKKIQRNQAIEDLRKRIKELETEKSKTESTQKRIQKLEDELQRLKERKEKEPIEKNKRPISEREEELKKQIEEERKKWADEQKLTPEQRALNALKSRYKSKIAELEDKLAKGDYGPDEKPEPIDLDKEGQELKDKYLELKDQRAIRLLKQEYSNRSKLEKTVAVASKTAKTGRTLQSSFDVSYPFRQTLNGLARQLFALPFEKRNGKWSFDNFKSQKNLGEQFGKMYRSFGSERYFRRVMDDIHNDPRYEMWQKAGLEFTDPLSALEQAKEEMFQSSYAEKIPIVNIGVKASHRAATVIANKMKWDIANQLAAQFEDSGKTFSNSPELYEATAKYANQLVGRGILGQKLQNAAPVIAHFVYSLRLYASRLQLLTYLANPRFYTKVPKEIRIEYLKDMTKFLALGGTVMSLAAATGLKVGLNPNDSDFGAIIAGDTRYDIWGGFKQYAVLLSRIMSGHATAEKDLHPLFSEEKAGRNEKTYGDLISRFVRTKLSPEAGSVVNIISGSDFAGKPVTIGSAAKDYFTPLLYKDVKDVWNDGGVSQAMLTFLLAAHGVGTQTYNKNSGGSSGGAGASGKVTKPSKPHKTSKTHK